MKINFITLALISIMGLVRVQAQQHNNNNNNNGITLSGFIYSNHEGKKEALYAANITAYANDSSIIGGVSSDNNGFFRLELYSKPDIVMISYIGYEPYKISNLIDIRENVINLDTCYLTPNNVIDEIVVSSSRIQHV